MLGPKQILGQKKILGLKIFWSIKMNAPKKLGPNSFMKIGLVTAKILLVWANVTRTYVA